jgi:hypothetical protein
LSFGIKGLFKTKNKKQNIMSVVETSSEHVILVYAYNIKNEVIFIEKADSGRQGYYCMGCGREMLAKKGAIRRPHFAHDFKDALMKNSCTFAEETLRHKLAKEILQLEKKIKVPTLYKQPPQGTDQVPRKIKESELIQAHSVRNEVQFYEDEKGKICWGRNLDFKEAENKNKYLLIQPDVTFFDKDNNPILLIELVATHKVDREKLTKIRRLGIDAVEVKVPKDSPEAINNIFGVTSQTKWLYNYEQEKTDYFSIPEGDRTGVLPLDDFQAGVSETPLCRLNRIRNLLRGIRKFVESEEYRTAEQAFRQSLRRVKDNTERDRERMRILQTGIETEFRAETERLENEANAQERAMEAEYLGKRTEITERFKTERTRLEQANAQERAIETEYLGKRTEITERFRAETERLENEANAPIETERNQIRAELTARFGAETIVIEKQTIAWEQEFRERKSELGDARSRIEEARVRIEKVRAILQQQYNSEMERIEMTNSILALIQDFYESNVEKYPLTLTLGRLSTEVTKNLNQKLQTIYSESAPFWFFLLQKPKSAFSKFMLAHPKIEIEANSEVDDVSAFKFIGLSQIPYLEAGKLFLSFINKGYNFESHQDEEWVTDRVKNYKELSTPELERTIIMKYIWQLQKPELVESMLEIEHVIFPLLSFKLNTVLGCGFTNLIQVANNFIEHRKPFAHFLLKLLQEKDSEGVLKKASFQGKLKVFQDMKPEMNKKYDAVFKIIMPYLFEK